MVPAPSGGPVEPAPNVKTRDDGDGPPVEKKPEVKADPSPPATPRSRYPGRPPAAPPLILAFAPPGGAPFHPGGAGPTAPRDPAAPGCGRPGRDPQRPRVPPHPFARPAALLGDRHPDRQRPGRRVPPGAADAGRCPDLAIRLDEKRQGPVDPGRGPQGCGPPARRERRPRPSSSSSVAWTSASTGRSKSGRISGSYSNAWSRGSGRSSGPRTPTCSTAPDGSRGSVAWKLVISRPGEEEAPTSHLRVGTGRRREGCRRIAGTRTRPDRRRGEAQAGDRPVQLRVRSRCASSRIPRRSRPGASAAHSRLDELKKATPKDKDGGEGDPLESRRAALGSLRDDGATDEEKKKTLQREIAELESIKEIRGTEDLLTHRRRWR